MISLKFKGLLLGASSLFIGGAAILKRTLVNEIDPAYLAVPRNGGHISFKEEDLASEEALRNLYEKWLQHYQIKRGGKDKEKHFQSFKKTVHRVENRRVIEDSFGIGVNPVRLNQYADLSSKEFRKYCCGCLE